MGPQPCLPTFLQYQNPIHSAGGAYFLCNEEYRLVGVPPDAGENLMFRSRVQRTGAVIQDQHCALPEQGSGQREALPLPA